MRTLFLSALVGASISFSSYTVQANQTWQCRGVVQSISDNAVMLRHEAIPELKWPAMTMEFKTANEALLKGMNPGTSIDFEFVERGQGEWVITAIKQKSTNAAHSGH